ncbi:hypothetical protein EHP00_750 [Ecytonucleospora hepatopenaei]|uniref:Uncharacterized protein n=1 Tax=Ecytonucleospora hepatopenaei TaxID=646526 RepID=A0A1W0E3C0_9MICR|nr:hypothetical protein EHP00_750 [Ecytonucleospora hepatopenaei]
MLLSFLIQRILTAIPAVPGSKNYEINPPNAVQGNYVPNPTQNKGQVHGTATNPAILNMEELKEKLAVGYGNTISKQVSPSTLLQELKDMDKSASAPGLNTIVTGLASYGYLISNIEKYSTSISPSIENKDKLLQLIDKMNLAVSQAKLKDNYVTVRTSLIAGLDFYEKEREKIEKLPVESKDKY